MSRYHSYLNSAAIILSTYKGEEPLTSFIKKHFSLNKKYGSTDRKQISHLCYCYFRLGKALQDIPVYERILTGLFLSSVEPNTLLQELKPEWNEKTALPVNEKINCLSYKFSIPNIFPWQNELSESINKEAFTLSHLQQPDLFLRLRPGKEKTVKQKLNNGGIGFQSLSPDCIALTNSSKIDKLIIFNKEAVVQDYSSQRVGEFISMVRPGRSDRVWDCCAASGGKSIMAKDILGDIDLTVSDLRASVLINLKKRFSEAGIIKYKSFVADLAHSLFTIHHSPFNFIIADVPCTGSGTWGRTPEQLQYFDAKKIEEYAALQKRIISNVIPQLEKGGYLLYITCSVFEKENEAAVDFIKEKFNLELVKMELLKGYDKKADTMFAALLKKPL